MDAFHLRAVADVDAGRADGNTLVAGHTIAETRVAALAELLPAPQRTAILAALVIIGDHDGVFIEQHGLKAAIRTDKRAGLLAKARKDAVEQQRKRDHEREPGNVLGRRVGDDLVKRLPADDVAQQHIADEK